MVIGEGGAFKSRVEMKIGRNLSGDCLILKNWRTAEERRGMVTKNVCILGRRDDRRDIGKHC